MRAASVFIALAALMTSFGVLAGDAGGSGKFDKAAFSEAQKAGKPVLIHVTAPWCPTCRAQKTVLALIMAKPEFKGLVRFDVDFDTGGETLREFNARTQSTLIVFKGETETGRSVGDTKADSIETLLKTAL